MSTKGEKEKAKTCPRRATKNGEGPLRGWRGIDRGSPKVGKGRKDFHEKAKTYPRRATKNGEGPRRGWRRLERDPPKVAKGRKDFHERQKLIRRATKDGEGPRKGSIEGEGGKMSTKAKGKKISTKGHEERRRAHEGVGGGSRGIRQGSGRGSAKELQGVGKDSKGVREGRRRTTKGEKISTKDTGAIHKGDPGTGRSRNYVPVVRSQRRA